MKKFKRVLALAMAVILSVPTLSTGTGTIPVKAADDSIELVVSNESAKYAGYETRKMSAGGNYAYCITPSKKTPDAGTYTKHYDVENYVKNVGDKAQAELTRNLAYYCWGAPGFNASNFPATWYDGSAMDDDKYIALSHIMLSDVASYDCAAALKGCNSKFKDWAYQNVLGYSASGDLINTEAPRYKLCWLTAPAGYALDSSVQSFTVTAGQNTALSVSDTPTNDPVRISINKVDSETGDKVQGGASLENAEFTVKYYAGYYNAGNLPTNATRTWVIKTVKRPSGQYVAILNNDCKVSGDDFYTNASGTVCLPLGTISIEETKAPEGYSLEGAYLQVGGVGEKITGKYVAQITQNGNLASLKGGNTFKVSDKIKRGDFKLTKIDTDNQNRMSDIPFRVTCKGTGESYIIKTDENGYFSSESSWNAHSKNTNGGGAYDGLWFSSADGSAKVDDSVGAMPYGDYTLEE